jgi:DNA-binding XRE family transcriptional regulator
METQYKIEKSQSNPDYWVCSDFVNNIVCIFKDGNFNIDQKIEYLGDNDGEIINELTTILRNMTNWLLLNHKYKMIYNIKSVFGENIKRLRIEKGLSIRELAIFSNVSKSTIFDVEQGNLCCRLDVIYKLSIGLNIPINELFQF